MSDAPVVNVDLAEMWDDPYPTLARMRAETPICFVPEMGATLLTKRDDIHACEKNVAIFSSDQPGGLMNVLMGKNMMRSDGDEHRKERFVYYPAISPRKVQAMWMDQFAAIAEAILDDFAPSDTGDADLVRGYEWRVTQGHDRIDQHHIPTDGRLEPSSNRRYRQLRRRFRDRGQVSRSDYQH